MARRTKKADNSLVSMFDYKMRRWGHNPAIEQGFCSLDVHAAALAHPCPVCGGKMYRDAWGDPPNEVKLHGCAMCGFERAVGKNAALWPKDGMRDGASRQGSGS